MARLDLALVQLTTPAGQKAAFEHARPLVEEAVKGGAEFVLLPECANLVEQRKDHKAGKLAAESDDVFTTGATLRACARVLAEAGAAQVTAVVVARVASGNPEL